MSKVVDVGAVPLECTSQVVTWRRHTLDSPPTGVDRGRDYALVNIMDAGGTDEGAYTPPSGVTISGRGRLELLRGAIDEALKVHEAPKPEPAKNWEVHLAGPDDLLAFATELEALRFCNKVNTAYVKDCERHPNPAEQVMAVATARYIGPPITP